VLLVVEVSGGGAVCALVPCLCQGAEGPCVIVHLVLSFMLAGAEEMLSFSLRYLSSWQS
jgi:hypothetical protein